MTFKAGLVKKCEILANFTPKPELMALRNSIDLAAFPA
jgi:hypothetical protein